MNLVDLHVGDCRTVLKAMPDESVHCVVTSPPYWSLRDYPTPESVEDRPTSSHEYVFLLSKSEVYFYDSDAVRSDLRPKTLTAYGSKRRALGGGDLVKSENMAKRMPERIPRLNEDGEFAGANMKSVWSIEQLGLTDQHLVALAELVLEDARRNAGHAPTDIGTVWTIPSAPFREAHFATFPPELAKTCILAGTSARGCCSKCGAPVVRAVDKIRTLDGEPLPEPTAIRNTSRTQPKNKPGPGHNRFATVRETKGWAPACSCSAPVAPCVVLDPFAGAGTTLLVAQEHGRRAIGIELSPKYAVIIRRRLRQNVLNFAGGTA